MKMNMTKKSATDRGFTLIEIIVSLAIFIVVAVIAIGAFLKILDANKQSQALQTAMNNADFALESMTRDIRVGSNYYYYNAAGSGQQGSSLSLNSPTIQSYTSTLGSSNYPAIAFYSSQNIPTGWNCTHDPIHVYRYNPSGNGVIERAEQTSCYGYTGPFIPLTSSDFNIKSFTLSVDTAHQPKVFISMQASAGSNLQNQTVFTIQTTTSERRMYGNGQ
jgi:type II secretory pathway pseudopilin PulG